MGKLDVARDIFNAMMEGKTSRKGVAIKDCRGKETMVVTRYGGDIILSFYDNETTELKFVFVVEMGTNNKLHWNDVFRRFVEIKAKLVQE